MSKVPDGPIECYVDESVHKDLGFVATAFILADPNFMGLVAEALRGSGLVPGRDEVKSSARMDADPRMRAARDALIELAGRSAAIAVVFTPTWEMRRKLGKQCLQALQSVLVRNGIAPDRIRAYFDTGIFPSIQEAKRLAALFGFLSRCQLFPKEDSRARIGIQVADVVCHSFAQVIRGQLTGKPKTVRIGGPGTGYPDDATGPLGRSLLLALRHSLLTRPVSYNGKPYDPATDPVIVDPIYDDPVNYIQHPELLGWGVQIAPEAGNEIRRAVRDSLGRLWLGCSR